MISVTNNLFHSNNDDPKSKEASNVGNNELPILPTKLKISVVASPKVVSADSIVNIGDVIVVSVVAFISLVKI